MKNRVNNKNVNFPTQFSLESTSNGISAIEPREVSLNENVHMRKIIENNI